VVKPEGKKPVAKCRGTCGDNIKVYIYIYIYICVGLEECVNGINLAQGRALWWAVVNTVPNP